MPLLKNPHPGEILQQEFLADIGISQNRLADLLHVPRNRIHAIIKGSRGISAETDLRLCRFFSLSDGFFLRLQNAHDTMEAKRMMAPQLAEITPYRADGV